MADRAASDARTGRGWLALLCCLLVVGLLGVLVPEFDPATKDVRRAGLGVWVAGDGYRARAVSVRVARGLVGGRATAAPVVAAPGTVWVVVTWQVASERKDLGFREVTVVTGDRTFHSRDTNAGVGHTVTPAGFTDTCDETFQLPLDALQGVRLLPVSIVGGLTVYQAQPTIDLALPAAPDVTDTALVERCRRSVTS